MLSSLFGGVSGHVEDTAGRASAVRQNPQMAEVNRQLRSFVPGETLQGEILSRNGGEIQLKISEDMVLNARVDQSVHLEIGQSVTFEVKSNGAALSLSPLFTNVSADVNILKALEMAGLPVNETSVAMTEQLMQAGLPVNKNVLQQIYREINSFPEHEISDVISLHRLKLPVNEGNMQQMTAYRNLEHQLLGGMENVMELLPETIGAMLARGETAEAGKLLQLLFPLLPEEAVGAQLHGEAAQAEDVPAETKSLREAELSSKDGVLLQEYGLAEKETVVQEQQPMGKPELPEKAFLESTHTILTGESGAGEGTATEVRTVVQRFSALLEQTELSPEEQETYGARLQQGMEAGDTGMVLKLAGQLFSAAAQRGEKEIAAFRDFFADKEIRKLLTDQLKEQWLLRPEELSEPEKVEQLYRRVNRQLKGMLQTLENGGQGESAVFRAVTTLSHGIDFLSQVNQLYTYVQLPLQLKYAGAAHGDLYIYTNKRNLAEGDGKVSALLHLDMEHLGPLDVYLTLEAGRLTSKFAVADEETLDFLEAHMDILTERLKKRGYDCSVSMTTKDTVQSERRDSGLAPLLQQTGNVLLTQYAFDVRT